MNLEISELDTKRFNIPVAKASAFDVSNFNEINEFCSNKKIHLLIARITTGDISVAQKMEYDNYRLMDTLVYYKYDYSKKGTPQVNSQTRISNISGNESYAIEVSGLARQSFHGYFGHYHADKNLDRSLCDEIYVDWAHRSCLDIKVADAVLAAFIDDKIAGFVTLKIRAENLGELILSGVSPSDQKRGIYQSLIFSGMEWLNKNCLDQIILSTQINNIAVQKVWARLGFEMDHSIYTFHKWFFTE